MTFRRFTVFQMVSVDTIAVMTASIAMPNL